MSESPFDAHTTVLAALEPAYWVEVWQAADISDLVRVMRVFDDDTRTVALSNMPPGVEEPIIPQALSVAEVDAALACVCAVARSVMR